MSGVMQTSSRIWSQVAASISYDDNHYTTWAIYIYMCVCVCAYMYVYLNVYMCVHIYIPRCVHLYVYVYIYINRLIDLEGRVFANGPGDLDSIPGYIIPKALKMVLNTSLLNTQQYKVRIKGKMEQFKERNSALPYTSV